MPRQQDCRHADAGDTMRTSLRGLPSVKQHTNSIEHTRLETAIAGASAFLKNAQLPHGEFRTYAASDKLLQKDRRFESSPFVTAWVVDSLGAWQGSQIAAMTRQAMGFLLGEMEGPGVWRYWSSRNGAHEYLPPDVDDTCCISAVLRRHRKPIPRNRKYVLENRTREGLFFTWMLARKDSPEHLARAIDPLINPGARAVWSMRGIEDNIDPGVNANAVRYLGARTETHSAIRYLVQTARSKRADESVGFYADPLVVDYLISRAYRTGVPALEEVRRAITSRVLSRLDRRGSSGNELLTALGICTLLNFGECPPEIRRAIRSLLDAQQKDGAWCGTAAFLGPAPYYGSEELTTACCIEALAKWKKVSRDAV